MVKLNKSFIFSFSCDHLRCETNGPCLKAVLYATNESLSFPIIGKDYFTLLRSFNIVYLRTCLRTSFTNDLGLKRDLQLVGRILRNVKKRNGERERKKNKENVEVRA